ncbi:hypothetical protein QJS66_16215 [Kocuria rhizophila]|nr:hypothetical protein QJS66_16215 [Kocuria rhizophila]
MLEFAAPSWMVQLTLTGYLIMLGAGQRSRDPSRTRSGGAARCRRFTTSSRPACSPPRCPPWPVLVVAACSRGGAAMVFVVINSAVRDRVSGDAATRAFAGARHRDLGDPRRLPGRGRWVGELFGWRPGSLVLALIGAVSREHRVPAGRPSPCPRSRRSRWPSHPCCAPTPGACAPPDAGAPRGRSRHLRVPLLYLGGASYVYQDRYGVGQADFGMIFGVTGLASVGGAVMGHRLAPA